jgi:hypothetical protein
MAGAGRGVDSMSVGVKGFASVVESAATRVTGASSAATSAMAPTPACRSIVIWMMPMLMLMMLMASQRQQMYDGKV